MYVRIQMSRVGKCVEVANAAGGRWSLRTDKVSSTGANFVLIGLI
jgi:hypothetical protein